MHQLTVSRIYFQNHIMVTYLIRYFNQIKLYKKCPRLSKGEKFSFRLTTLLQFVQESRYKQSEVTPHFSTGQNLLTKTIWKL